MNPTHRSSIHLFATRLFVGFCAVQLAISQTPVAAQVFLIEPRQAVPLTEREVVVLVHQLAFRGKSSEVIRKELQAQAEKKLDQLNAICNLTSEQKSQLKLAARGDATRYLHSVAKVVKDLTKELEGAALTGDNVGPIIEKVAVATEHLSSRLFDKTRFSKKSRFLSWTMLKLRNTTPCSKASRLQFLGGGTPTYSPLNNP